MATVSTYLLPSVHSASTLQYLRGQLSKFPDIYKILNTQYISSHPFTRNFDIITGQDITNPMIL
jgi:hypothetical protein